MREDAPAGFLDPGKMLDHVHVQAGNTVADFGCGAGHFSFEAARRVGDEGTVWAFDVLPSALEAVESAVQINNIKNVTARRADLERDHGSGLEDGSVDVVIAKDILFQNDGKDKILGEAHRVLKENGELLVIEWSVENTALGPVEKLRIPSEKLKELVKAGGFFIEEELPAGDYHEAIVARKGR